MGDTNISSNNQSGGITAKTVKVKGGDLNVTSNPSHPPQKVKWYKRAWAIITAIVAFMAALVAILEFFKIKPF